MEETRQIAALPIALHGKPGTRVLLVTSRDTGRWVVPKGWPMDGKKPWTAAKIEALEEAGAIGTIRDTPLGSYGYDKRLGDGSVLPCRVDVYPMIVTGLKKRWKERKQRKRRWVSAGKAATMVQEPELRLIFLDLAGLADAAVALGRGRP
ncbi:NUDIX hydrolase [Mangrovicoccus algicola]|uniref:NUDIX hydrolase n=1 Tax=Mangrovicoccus algicola TaxID=2771008 RepID=A0A8J6Z8F4_9RHOB|nr:NUDIX hydrolase [Mangrovicoccus algicola]MBE3639819.1 NUDIX hydrolase [Mangrovicoccus algicola]